MPSANLDLVRSILGTWGRGDWNSARWASAEWAHPEIEFVLSGWLEDGTWTGLAAMADAMRSLLSAWEDFRVVPDEYRELDSERVLVLVHGVWRGKASSVEFGVDAPRRGADLFHVRDGKVTRLIVYRDRERALSELGLAPESETRMSDSANVELVRSIYAAMQRGDWTSADWVDPEIEFVIADGPSPGRWTGLAGIKEGFRDFLGAWEEWRSDVDEYRELDEERVLVFTRFSARGKTSGLDLGQLRAKGAAVFHIRDGKVTQQVFYLDRERALADLGLAPEGGSER